MEVTMKKYLLLMMTLLTVFLVSCQSTTYETISASVAKSMMDNDSSIILVDVRTQEEYDKEHIQDAVLLPLDSIETDADEVIPDKSAVYIIYCRSGNRSQTASELLVSLGYENIYDMGGIIYWPYATVS